MSEYNCSKRVSVYLSTENEVDTIPLLKIMFQQNKQVINGEGEVVNVKSILLQVFVPTYFGSEMKMLKLSNMEDYEALPMTKWKIKQPNPDDVNRENPMMTGEV